MSPEGPRDNTCQLRSEIPSVLLWKPRTLNYRVWVIPAVLLRGIPGKTLRAFPACIENTGKRGMFEDECTKNTGKQGIPEINSVRKIPRFSVRLVPHLPNPKYYLCVQSVAKMRRAPLLLLHSSTTIPHFTEFLGVLAFSNPTCCSSFIFRKATFACIYRALTSKTPAFFLAFSAFIFKNATFFSIFDAFIFQNATFSSVFSTFVFQNATFSAFSALFFRIQIQNFGFFELISITGTEFRKFRIFFVMISAPKV